jgi:hypothetical protein
MSDRVPLLNPLVSSARHKVSATGQDTSNGTTAFIISAFGFIIGQAHKPLVSGAQHFGSFRVAQNFFVYL